jgi:hypothetical protein
MIARYACGTLYANASGVFESIGQAVFLNIGSSPQDELGMHRQIHRTNQIFSFFAQRVPEYGVICQQAKSDGSSWFK